MKEIFYGIVLQKKGGIHTLLNYSEACWAKEIALLPYGNEWIDMMEFAEIVICDSLNLLIIGVSCAKAKICNF